MPLRLGWLGAGTRGARRCSASGVRAAAPALGAASGSRSSSWRFTAVMNAYEGIPVPVLLLLVPGRRSSPASRSHTRFGRHLYAIGGNREAAFYSGISIERHIVGVFTLMGLLCRRGRHRAHRARGLGHLRRRAA